MSYDDQLKGYWKLTAFISHFLECGLTIVILNEPVQDTSRINISHTLAYRHFLYSEILTFLHKTLNLH